MKSKSFDTFLPLSSVLVPADQVPDPQQLRIVSRVNGTLKQDCSTADMVFSVAQLIAFLSQDATLLPGNLASARARI